MEDQELKQIIKINETDINSFFVSGSWAEITKLQGNQLTVAAQLIQQNPTLLSHIIGDIPDNIEAYKKLVLILGGISETALSQRNNFISVYKKIFNWLANNSNTDILLIEISRHKELTRQLFLMAPEQKPLALLTKPARKKPWELSSEALKKRTDDTLNLENNPYGICFIAGDQSRLESHVKTQKSSYLVLLGNLFLIDAKPWERKYLPKLYAIGQKYGLSTINAFLKEANPIDPDFLHYLFKLVVMNACQINMEGTDFSLVLKYFKKFIDDLRGFELTDDFYNNFLKKIESLQASQEIKDELFDRILTKRIVLKSYELLRV